MGVETHWVRFGLPGAYTTQYMPFDWGQNEASKEDTVLCVYIANSCLGEARDSECIWVDMYFAGLIFPIAQALALVYNGRICSPTTFRLFHVQSILTVTRFLNV